MNKKSKRFEDQTVAIWPEILDDLHIESIPSEYVKEIKVTFKTGREWLVEIDPSHHPDLDMLIEELYQEYDDVIETINFNIDIEQIKEDIEKRTRTFLKKRK